MVEKGKWKWLELPLTRKIENIKQYCILEGLQRLVSLSRT